MHGLCVWKVGWGEFWAPMELGTPSPTKEKENRSRHLFLYTCSIVSKVSKGPLVAPLGQANYNCNVHLFCLVLLTDSMLTWLLHA